MAQQFSFYYVHVCYVSFLLCVTNNHKLSSLKHKSIISQFPWIEVLVWVSCRVFCSGSYLAGAVIFIRDLMASSKLTVVGVMWFL